jgi:hypothetical protein
MCTSGLFTLYDSMRFHGTGEDERQILSRMEPLATELARISQLIFENEAEINFTLLSP